MDIHINKTENQNLNNDEFNINIETSKDNKNIESLIEYIENFDNQKIFVYDDYNKTGVVPTLMSLRKKLQEQKEKEAQELALS